LSFWPGRPHKKFLCLGLINPEVKRMKKKWCQRCPIWISYPGVLLGCNRPCPEEAYIEVGN